MEGSFGLNLITVDAFLITDIDKIIIYDANNFNIVNTIPIKLFVSETREPTQVIGMTISKCEKWLAVISGKNLIKNEQALN